MTPTTPGILSAATRSEAATWVKINVLLFRSTPGRLVRASASANEMLVMFAASLMVALSICWMAEIAMWVSAVNPPRLKLTSPLLTVKLIAPAALPENWMELA